MGIFCYLLSNGANLQFKNHCNRKYHGVQDAQVNDVRYTMITNSLRMSLLKVHGNSSTYTSATSLSAIIRFVRLIMSYGKIIMLGLWYSCSNYATAYF